MNIVLNRLQAPFVLQATNETGNSIQFDASESIGGKGEGIRPMEALASSLAACASIDILLILKKQKSEPESYQVEIKAERVDTVPAIFKSIHLIFKFKGVDLDKAKRAVELSMTKYCSVTKMLEKSCEITFETEVLN